MTDFKERARDILSKRNGWFHSDECATELSVALERVHDEAIDAAASIAKKHALGACLSYCALLESRIRALSL